MVMVPEMVALDSVNVSLMGLLMLMLLLLVFVHYLNLSTEVIIEILDRPVPLLFNRKWTQANGCRIQRRRR